MRQKYELRREARISSGASLLRNSQASPARFSCFITSTQAATVFLWSTYFRENYCSTKCRNPIRLDRCKMGLKPWTCASKDYTTLHCKNVSFSSKHHLKHSLTVLLVWSILHVDIFKQGWPSYWYQQNNIWFKKSLKCFYLHGKHTILIQLTGTLLHFFPVKFDFKTQV